MKKFYLKSMGCKSNQFEGQIVSQNLIEAGYQEVKKLEDADLYILNSFFIIPIFTKLTCLLLPRIWL